MKSFYFTLIALVFVSPVMAEPIRPFDTSFAHGIVSTSRDVRNMLNDQNKMNQFINDTKNAHDLGVDVDSYWQTIFGTYNDKALSKLADQGIRIQFANNVSAFDKADMLSKLVIETDDMSKVEDPARTELRYFVSQERQEWLKTTFGFESIKNSVSMRQASFPIQGQQMEKPGRYLENTATKVFDLPLAGVPSSSGPVVYSDKVIEILPKTNALPAAVVTKYYHYDQLVGQIGMPVKEGAALDELSKFISENNLNQRGNSKFKGMTRVIHTINGRPDSIELGITVSSEVKAPEKEGDQKTEVAIKTQPAASEHFVLISQQGTATFYESASGFTPQELRDSRAIYFDSAEAAKTGVLYKLKPKLLEKVLKERKTSSAKDQVEELLKMRGVEIVPSICL